MGRELTIQVPYTAVGIRREMAKNPAVIKALEPVERSVFLASTAKTIAEYSDPDLAAELFKALTFIAKDVGYRATSESDMRYLVIRIAEILKRYYSVFTLRDFRMAFEMSIMGALDEFLPKGRDGQADRGHYQNFNAEYICKILNAYKFKRAAVLKKANDALPEPEPARDAVAEAQYANRMRKDCIEAYEFFKEAGRLPDVSPIMEMLLYETLSAAGLAPAIEVTAEEQKVIYFRTINAYSRNGMIADVRRLEAEGLQSEELQFRAYALARRKALRKAFETMVSKGIDINDYIKIER